MPTELSGFKVVYKERVLRAVCLDAIDFGEDWPPEIGKVDVPKFITIIAINEDGNIVVIRDEAWMFQFIPVVERRC